MITYYRSIKSLKIIIFFLFIISSSSLSAKDNNVVCSTLLEVLEVNTNAYKNCLLKKAGESFTIEELSICKKYYLIEIERLSYVYKNTCK